MSLVIIIAAAVIVFHKVLPTLQNGIFAGQSAAADSLTLDQTEVQPGRGRGLPVTLVPTFAPGRLHRHRDLDQQRREDRCRG